MRWPFRRRREGTEQAPATSRPSREWAGVAPLRPVGLRPEPEVASAARFQSTLATRWQQPPILAPLGHELNLTAPAGLTSGVVAPVQGYANAPDLPLPRLAVAGGDSQLPQASFHYPRPRGAVIPVPESSPSPSAAVPAEQVPSGEPPPAPEPAAPESASAPPQVRLAEPHAPSVESAPRVRRLGRIGPPLHVDAVPPAVLRAPEPGEPAPGLAVLPPVPGLTAPSPLAGPAVPSPFPDLAPPFAGPAGAPLPSPSAAGMPPHRPYAAESPSQVAGLAEMPQVPDATGPPLRLTGAADVPPEIAASPAPKPQLGVPDWFTAGPQDADQEGPVGARWVAPPLPAAPAEPAPPVDPARGAAREVVEPATDRPFRPFRRFGAAPPPEVQDSSPSEPPPAEEAPARTPSVRAPDTESPFDPAPTWSALPGPAPSAELPFVEVPAMEPPSPPRPVVRAEPLPVALVRPLASALPSLSFLPAERTSVLPGLVPDQARPAPPEQSGDEPAEAIPGLAGPQAGFLPAPPQVGAMLPLELAGFPAMPPLPGFPASSGEMTAPGVPPWLEAAGVAPNPGAPPPPQLPLPPLPIPNRTFGALVPTTDAGSPVFPESPFQERAARRRRVAHIGTPVAAPATPAPPEATAESEPAVTPHLPGAFASMRANATVPAPAATGPDDEPDLDDEEPAGGDRLDAMAGELYDRIRDRLRRELLVDRERALMLTDWR